jgi:hypothetical protein
MCVYEMRVCFLFWKKKGGGLKLSVNISIFGSKSHGLTSWAPFFIPLLLGRQKKTSINLFSDPM